MPQIGVVVPTPSREPTVPRTPSTARRVTVSLRVLDSTHLEEVVAATELSPNDAIRKALATEAWVQRELRRGSTIVVRDPEGTERQVVFVG